MDERLDKSWLTTAASTTNIGHRKLGTVGGPVTCLSLPSPQVCVYSQGSGLERCLAGQQHKHRDRHRLIVFPNGVVIHGMKHHPTESYTAVFGGRQVALVRHAIPPLSTEEECKPMETIPLKGSNKTSTTLPFLQCSDWIWEVEWLDKTNNNIPQTTACSLLVGLAHNTVQLWNFEGPSTTTNNNGNPFLLTQIHQQTWTGEKRCLTYCLDFGHSNSTNGVSIAMGSAMQDIRVWTLNIDRTPPAKTTNVEKEACLVGHQGVIHNVKWVTIAKGAPTELVSASDDRSVRLWKQQQQDTRSWQCLWIGWGHTARIWGLGVLQTTSGSVVVTTGEDSTTRLWQHGSEVGILRGHACQCIWSVDTHNASGMIATGANDGTVALHDIATMLKGGNENGEDQVMSGGLQQKTLLVPDDRPPPRKVEEESETVPNGGKEKVPSTKTPDKLQPQQPGNTKNRKKKQRKKADPGQLLFGMKFYTPNQLLIATRTGNLISVDTAAKAEPLWSPVGSWSLPSGECAADHDFEIQAESGCSLACHLNPQDGTLWVALGTTQGLVVVMYMSKVSATSSESQQAWRTSQRFVITSGKTYRSVQSLAWIQSTNQDKKNTSPSLLTFHINNVLWWSPFSNAGTVSSPTWVLELNTLAIPISFAYNEVFDRLFVGDTRGNLVMFHLKAEMKAADGVPGTDAICTLAPSGILSRLHQKEHVTDIVIAPTPHNNGSCSRTQRILSVGNDGCICESYFDVKKGTLQSGLSVVASSALTGIAQVWVAAEPTQNTCNERVVVSGYYGNTFVMLDVSRGKELFRADTGGRQRLHDFWGQLESAFEGSGRAHQNLAVCIHRKQDGRNDIVLHGREYNGSCSSEVAPMLQADTCLGVGLHGETIYSASFFPYNVGQNGWGRWALLTGSEDCGSKLSFFDNGVVMGTKRLPSQESSVRAVCSSTSVRHGSTSSLLTVGGSKLTLQFFRICDNVGVDTPVKNMEDSSGDVGDVQLRFLGYGRTNERDSIDHRINAVKSRALVISTKEDIEGEGSPQQHVVAAGDSQGHCHIYKVDLDAPDSGKNYTWIGLPLSPNKSTRKPILSMELLQVRSRLLLAVGTTGGDVELWDLPADIGAKEWDVLVPPKSQEERVAVFPSEHIGSYKAHQMGANSISATAMNGGIDDKVLVCSGGDDQAISVCEIQLQLNTDGTKMCSSTVVKLTTVKEASSSAIKEVSFLDEFRFLSVGYTQRLAVWKRTPSSDATTSAAEDSDEVNLLWTSPASVGDVNCLARTKATKPEEKSIVAVGGAGVDLFSL